MNSSEEALQKKFKEVLFNTYKLSTEVENISINNLIEEIKQQLVIIIDRKK